MMSRGYTWVYRVYKGIQGYTGYTAVQRAYYYYMKNISILRKRNLKE